MVYLNTRFLKLLPVILLIFLGLRPRVAWSQFQTPSTQFKVLGNGNTFYPVVWKEAWDQWEKGATELEITRADVHVDTEWRGSVIAKFRIHTTSWGNESNFIDAQIRYYKQPFIAGWADASTGDNNKEFIIWLRGGSTYSYRSNNSSLAAPRIFDNDPTHYPLPFQNNGGVHHAKTQLDPYVNNTGMTYSGNAFFNGSATNVFKGAVGIGTDKTDAEYNLHVTKGIRTEKVKVEAVAGWADFVFDPKYKLPPLDSVARFIHVNQHLPAVPSAHQVEKEGIDLGEMDAVLLRKIEELTLYMIEQEKRLRILEAANKRLRGGKKKRKEGTRKL